MTAKPSTPARRRRLLSVVAVAALLLAAGAGAYGLLHHQARRPHADLVLHRAAYERVELTVTGRGDLESAGNSDIVCRVRSGNRNTTVATTIKWVIDDGSEVKGPRPGKPTGDLLVELDESGLQEQLKAQRVAVAQAESDRVQAEEAYKITVSQNVSDIKTAETQVELKTIDLSKYTGQPAGELRKPETLARLREELKRAARDARRPAREVAAEDLKRYKTGDYLAALKDSLGQVETAESDLSQQEEREAWALRMVKKGYQTPKQAQTETALKGNYQLAVGKATLALDVLVKYTKVQTVTQYVGALEEALRSLDRVTSQARSKEVQARTDRDTRRSLWELATAHENDINVDIKRCKIYAPHDGRVLYYLPEQARSGSGSQVAVVAQGEPVREGQRLLQLPDLAHLQVSLRIHEALVTHVRPGQPAAVRLEAYPGRVLRGHVVAVSPVGLPPSWRTGDVITYPTSVAIDPEEVAGLDLRTGLTADVSIDADDGGPAVLAVPARAIFRGSDDAEPRLFVMTPDGPEERPVLVGTANGDVAEIRGGLEEGDEVVLNPAALHDEDARPD
jgi:multidrug resistance efflux pump